MKSRPYVDAVVFMGAAWADVRAQVHAHPESSSEVAWATSGSMVPGGRAALAACAAKSLGRQFVELIACVGDDVLGAAIRDAYQHCGVTTRLVETVPGVPTGIRQIVRDANGARRIVGMPNASNCLDEAHMSRADTTIFGSDMLFVTLEAPFDTVVRAITTAVAHDVPVVLNASPLPSPDGVIDIPKRVLSHVDVLLLNWESAMLMTGFVDLTGPSGAELCQRLMNLGPKAVVVTLGEHGSIVANSHKQGLIEPFSGPVVDEAWVGDVFAGALAVGLSSQAKGQWHWEELVEAGRFASAAAGLSAGREAQLDQLPTRQEVERLISSSISAKRRSTHPIG